MAGLKANSVRRIGVHTSIARSLTGAAEQAAGLGCNTFQIFSRSPRMWRAGKLDAAEVARFKEGRAKYGLTPLVIHGNYLMNMASMDSAIRRLSIRAFRDEVQRALTLGADFLVIHPGSYKGQTLEKGLQRLTASIARAVRGIQWNGLQLLLENTAGGGQSIGRDFPELAELRELIQKKAEIPIGFCIDTAHCYEAGFDISSADGLENTVKRIEHTVGLNDVRVIHANDSRTALGSHVDRHEHIGAGYIGRRGFRGIVNHPKLAKKPFILETPVDEKGTDRRNVQTLKALVRGRRRIAKP